jgi:hypothetical protein
MKNLILICCLFFGVSSFAQGNSKLSIDWKFTGINEGYDHDNKVEVYLDGVLVKTSTVSKQSQKNSVTIETTKGKHNIRIVNFALYENKWEEHTIVNNYSLDAKYETDLKLKKKNKISLIFDIDKEIVIETVK